MRPNRSVNQLIQEDLLIGISEPSFPNDEGFFTEWKLGNMHNEKPRDSAFGGVFFCLSIKKSGFSLRSQCHLSLCEQHIAAAARIMYRMEHVCHDAYRGEEWLRMRLFTSMKCAVLLHQMAAAATGTAPD